jgi:hypothetical protein
LRAIAGLEICKRWAKKENTKKGEYTNVPKSKERKQRANASLPKRAPRKSGRRGIGPPPETDESSETPKKPRQARLPGIEDPEIEELEAAAESYADVRDQRMALTPVEAKHKEDLLALMHKHEKKSYVHGNIDIKVVVESEKVRVRIKKEE